MQTELLQFICIKKLCKQKTPYKSKVKFASLPLAKKQIICAIALLFIIKLSWATHDYDTIIIGAGVSGLTAAHHLHNAQQKVLIIEAKNRLGGRVYTSYDWGFATDLGASWIHAIENNPLMPLIGKQSIIINSYSNSDPVAMLTNYALYDSEGKPVSKQTRSLFSSLTRDFLRYCQTRSEMISFAQNLNTFAKQKKLTSEQLALLSYALENIYTYEFADNLTKLSRNVHSVSEASLASGKNALVPEGYFQLFRQFTQHVPIHLNQIVSQINYGPDGVDIITQHDKYHANQVIITVPLGVLKANTIKFHPDLPMDKRTAISKLGMGSYEKLYLLFDKVFWDKDSEWIGMLPQDKQEAFNIFNYYKYTKKPVLIVFTSGKLARDMEKEHLTEWVMQHLRRIYGSNIPKPIKNKKTHWGSDPFTRGSYSYLPVKVDKSVIGTLAQPVANRLYFAGEATSTTDPSTVHGAYLSGIRAAEEVLASIKHSEKNREKDKAVNS
ncbi:TPA: NAD(P)-binding protein [Legionella pneumophila]|nr:NAD(P)-binding protein [Legionella pneumophila]